MKPPSSAEIKSTGHAAASDTRFTLPSYRRSRIVVSAELSGVKSWRTI
jgi:hypothetical protein